MGSKTSMLVAGNGQAKAVLRSIPELDDEATSVLVRKLFADERLIPTGEGNLAYTCPLDDEIVAGCFPGTAVVAAKEFRDDHPSKLARKFIDAFGRQRVVLHAMHSGVDWFAFAVWENGTLIRSLSLSPDTGVLEDIGRRLDFEHPFWDGKHPAVEPGEDESYPFPFHPVEFGEAALEYFFGFQIEGFVETEHPAPESVRLLRFRREKRPWWKFWKAGD